MDFSRSFSVARFSPGSFYGEEIARTDSVEKAVLVALGLSLESWSPGLASPSGAEGGAREGVKSLDGTLVRRREVLKLVTRDLVESGLPSFMVVGPLS